jgi:hypothetical protein
MSVTDSAGVTIVRIPDLQSMPFPVWRSRLVYSTDALDTLELGPSPQAVFLGDSSLVVGGGPDLYLVSIAGHLLRKLGRRGEGPGEFEHIGVVKLTDDGSVVVGDLATGRTTVMLESGKVLRTVRRLDGADKGREVELVTALADGRLISTFWQDRPNRGDLEGVQVGNHERDPVPLVLHDSLGARVGQLGQWLGLERARVPLGGETARLPLTHARSVMYASRKDVTVISPTDSLDLSIFVGTALRVRMISVPSGQPPSRAQVEASRRAVLDWDKDVGTQLLSAMSGAPTVPALPSIGPLAVDSRGNIWIGSYVPPGESLRHWRIIAPLGHPVGSIELPAIVDPILPGRSEILDVYGELLALVVRYDDRFVVEIRRIKP